MLSRFKTHVMVYMMPSKQSVYELCMMKDSFIPSMDTRVRMMFLNAVWKKNILSGSKWKQCCWLIWHKWFVFTRLLACYFTHLCTYTLTTWKWNFLTTLKAKKINPRYILYICSETVHDVKWQLSWRWWSTLHIENIMLQVILRGRNSADEVVAILNIN